MPTLYVLAGPNGIGKTTSSYDLVPKNTPLINSDEIAKEIRKAGHISVNTQEYSNREAIQLMEEQREQRNSFAIETNLADLDTWKFLLEVQKTGYNLHVKYLSTDDLGEHYVNPEIVKERYINGLNLLNYYFHKPDILELFDNSKQMTRIVEINHGQILELADSVPDGFQSI
jgi:predicted ABC-type ATPase